MYIIFLKVMDMPFCKNCGRLNDPNTKFCGVCGAQINPNSKPAAAATPTIPVSTTDSVNLLKQAYGEKVKMPFGYFSHDVRIKLL